MPPPRQWGVCLPVWREAWGTTAWARDLAWSPRETKRLEEEEHRHYIVMQARRWIAVTAEKGASMRGRKRGMRRGSRPGTERLQARSSSALHSREAGYPLG